MKRTSRFISSLAFVLMALGAAPEADAALKARSATIDPATGYPTWYQDTNNLALTDCMDQNGFCLAAFTGAALPTAKANISAANFPAESFYYMADTAGVSPLGVISVTIWEAALEAGFASAVVDGGQAVFSRIRYRINVTVPGTYVVTHPYGEETYVVAAGDIGPAHEINFTNDVPGLIPQDFDSAVTGGGIGFAPPTVGPTFLTNAAGTFITDPVSGNRYIGQPGAPVAVVGSPTGNNFVRVVGGGDTFLSSTFGLQGKVIGLDVAPKSSLDLGQKVVLTPSAAQTVTVTNTTGNPIIFAADLNAVNIKGGADAADFLIAASTTVGAPQFCAGATLAAAAPGNSCSFDVTFTPAAAAKTARVATLLLAPLTEQPAPAVDPPLADPPPVTMSLSGSALVTITTAATSPHGTIVQDPTTIVTPAGTAPAGVNVTFTVTPSNSKFKVKSVDHNGTLLGTVATPATLPNTPPFTINAGDGATPNTVSATFMPSGDLDASGTLDVSDALKALRILSGVQSAPDPDDLDNSALKVAPLTAGVPVAINPTRDPNIGDVLVILRRVLGLDKW